MHTTLDDGAWTTMAPFDRYLQPLGDTPPPAGSDLTPPSSANQYTHASYTDRSRNSDAQAGHSGYGQPSSSSTAGQVQFQMPPFMHTGLPTLAQGGGAEVLPVSMFGSPGGMASSWLNNNAGLPTQSFSHTPSALSAGNPFASLNDYLTPAASSSNALTSGSSHLAHDSSGVFTSGSAPWTASSISPTSPHFSHSHPPISAPSALGLPVYSASGFDILSILGRVANRPSPKIQLGPVDLTCAFLVTDVRRYDNPIVYASPTFCQLTGYDENEIIGRNCRFLQSPDGRVQKGEERRYTNPEAVSLLRKSLSADKEVQTSLVNYKKGGEAFINLVTVIPVGGGVHNGSHEQDEVAYHVGFQVDLTRQPNAILQRLKDGSYIVNYSSSSPLSPSVGRRATNAPQSTAPMSADLRRLLSSQAFVRSLPLSTRTNTMLASDKPDAYDDQQLLDMMLLEALPDFVHVLSLKGVFLYVAPSVRRVLGYAPEELVGKSIADICHPADLVPLMRELKESSAAPAPMGGEAHTGVMTGVQSIQAALAPSSAGGSPKTVDLLFRARAKDGHYVWIDCRGRLHVEPGKGRKAIIMSGRQRGMPRLAWATVARAGGLAPPAELGGPVPRLEDGEPAPAPATVVEREFWAELAQAGTVLFVGSAVRDVLGWGVGEVIGRTVLDWVDDAETRRALERVFAGGGGTSASAEPERLECELRAKDGRRVGVTLVLYRTDAGAFAGATSSLGSGRPAPAPLVAQVKVRGAPGEEPAPSPLCHGAGEDLFVELETSKETSWQYELQQLKYANARLAEEVGVLEGGGLPRPAAADATKREGGGGGEKGKEPVVSSGEWRRSGGFTLGKRTWDEAQDDGPT